MIESKRTEMIQIIEKELNVVSKNIKQFEGALMKDKFVD
jgi:hypothetical protein